VGSQPERARRWTKKARTELKGLDSQEAARQTARAGSWYATVLQMEGRTADALKWAERAVVEAQAAGDKDALGGGYSVMAAAHGELGNEGAMEYMHGRWRPTSSRATFPGRPTFWRTSAFCANGQVVGTRPVHERGRAEALKIGDTVGAPWRA
jgi:hypothetical protein